MLARLLLDPGGPVPADELVEAAWPGDPRDAATRSLSVRLASLRAFLEPERPRGAPSTLLVRDGAAYRLAVDAGQVDAHRFQQLVEQGEYEQALELWGTPFEDLVDHPGAQAEIQRLEALAVRARVGRARALVAEGGHEEALDDLRPACGGGAAPRGGGARPRARPLPLRPPGRGARRAARAGGPARRARPGHRPRDARARAADPQPRRRRARHGHAGAASGQPLLRPRARGRARRRPARRRPAGDDRRRRRRRQEPASHSSWPVQLDLPSWWCELAPVGLDADVPGALAEAVGIELASGGAGLEHVVDAGRAPARAARARQLRAPRRRRGRAPSSALAAGGPLRILATSRTPLGVDGERVLGLGRARAGGGTRALPVARERRRRRGAARGRGDLPPRRRVAARDRARSRPHALADRDRDRRARGRELPGARRVRAARRRPPRHAPGRDRLVLRAARGA